MRQLLLCLNPVLLVLRKAVGVFGAAVVELLLRLVELFLPFRALGIELFFAAFILGGSTVELEAGDLDVYKRQGRRHFGRDRDRANQPESLLVNWKTSAPGSLCVPGPKGDFGVHKEPGFSCFV